jgi:hypothetical protein
MITIAADRPFGGARALPIRQQTIRATSVRSHDLLTGVAGVLVRRAGYSPVDAHFWHVCSFPD